MISTTFSFCFLFSCFFLLFLLLLLLHDMVRKRLGYFKRQVANMVRRKRKREREREREREQERARERARASENLKPKKAHQTRRKSIKRQNRCRHTRYHEKKHAFSCHISRLYDFLSFSFSFFFFFCFFFLFSIYFPLWLYFCLMISRYENEWKMEKNQINGRWKMEMK